LFWWLRRHAHVRACVTTNDIDFISLAPNHWRTRLVEIAKVRGSISGTVSKRMNLAVESAKNEQGQRAYKVK
jgi:hypothetical protein